MISNLSIQGKFPIKTLRDVADFLDSRRRPITASDKISGPYPYCGANGQQNSVNGYIFDEPLILLAEDGGMFDQPDRGIAYPIQAYGQPDTTERWLDRVCRADVLFLDDLFKTKMTQTQVFPRRRARERTPGKTHPRKIRTRRLTPGAAWNILWHMKTVTIRQIHHDFSAVLALVAQGEEVTVLNRTRPVARICPPRPVAPAKFKMPDFAARAKAIFGDSRIMPNIILEEREERQW